VFEHAFGRPEDRVEPPVDDPLEGFDDPDELRAMLDALRMGVPDSPGDVEQTLT
jgi:hypothetical protein